jgi:YidC/Oxa1 family membrane protein insertase
MTLEQMDLNKRLMIALVLSFAILFGFSYLFPKPQMATDANATKAPSAQTTQQSGTAPSAPAVTGAQQSDQAAPAATPSAQKAVAEGETLATVETRKYRLKIDRFGRIVSVILKEPKYKQDDGQPLELIDPARTRPLELRFADAKINEEAFRIPYTASASELKVE